MSAVGMLVESDEITSTYKLENCRGYKNDHALARMPS